MPSSIEPSFEYVLQVRKENNRIMSSSIFTGLLLLGLVSFLGASIIERQEPSNVECHTNSECPPDHCCVLSPARYSIPQCSPMREKLEICRPSNETLNTTLYYPNDRKLKITDVHYILCPCNLGLTCDTKEGVCS